MTQTPGPIMRLIGDLRPHGVDWPVSEFAILFERLGSTVEGTGVIKRYVVQKYVSLELKWNPSSISPKEWLLLN